MSADSLFQSDLLAAAGEELASTLKAVLVAVRTRGGGGSGTIWSDDGLVVTNSHVVPGDEAELALPDGRRLRARLTARDPELDLAALRVEATGLRAAKPADSDAVRVGQLAFAIGNPWGARGALTAGVITGKGAASPENGVPLEEAIRADVRLAPGNSGGPLADAEGRVIGINSMIAGGMAIAVPANTVERFLSGGVPGAAFLGISGRVIPLPPAIAASFQARDGAGLLVTGVAPGSPAVAAGLIPGDVIVRLDRVRGGAGPVARGLQRLQPGRSLHLEFLRGWDMRETDARPAARS